MQNHSQSFPKNGLVRTACLLSYKDKFDTVGQSLFCKNFLFGFWDSSHSSSPTVLFISHFPFRFLSISNSPIFCPQPWPTWQLSQSSWPPPTDASQATILSTGPVVLWSLSLGKLFQLSDFNLIIINLGNWSIFYRLMRCGGARAEVLRTSALPPALCSP